MERKKNKQPKLNIKKGDKVKVIDGDDKRREGVVQEVMISKRRVIVEGINMITKHEKPSAGKPEGGIKKTEAPIHISNVMLIDPASGKTTRVGRKPNGEGALQRYSKKTGELIK